MTHNELLDLLEDLREYATGNPIDDMDEDDAEDETVADLYRRVRPDRRKGGSEMTNHICCHKDCGDVGYPCYLEEEQLAGARYEVIQYLCARHAVERGYCCGCGRFFAGNNAFGFGSGVCEDCRYEAAEEEEEEDYP